MSCIDKQTRVTRQDVEQNAILKRWRRQGDHGSDIGQSDRDYGEKRMRIPGDVCLGIGSEWSWRRCRGDALVCGKVRYLGCYVVLWFGGRWVFEARLGLGDGAATAVVSMLLW